MMMMMMMMIKSRNHTPGLHNKIPANKIFARVWVAPIICLHYQR